MLGWKLYGIKEKILKIAAVIVTSRRLELFKRAALSVLKENIPIFVVINGEDFAAQEFCRENEIEYLFLKNNVTPAEARNLAVKELNSEWIHFLDDDAYIESGFYLKAEKIILKSQCEIIGGPNLTPPASNSFQVLSGKALGNFWGAGPCSKRYADKHKSGICGEEALILCNLFVKREVLKNLSFPENFICGEENSLLAKAKRNYKFHFSSELSVLHERRSRMSGFLRQIYKYGIGRGQNIQCLDFNLYHLIPLFCVGTAAALLLQNKMDILLGLASVYLVLNIWFSRKDSRLFLLFPLIHVVYALGCVRGILYLGNIFEHKFLFFNSSKLFGKKNF